MAKTLTRRGSLLAFTSLAAGPALTPAVVRAGTTLPDKPLRIVIGFVAGGGADAVARVIAKGLERRTGRYVTVESRPGSAGANPGELIKNGPADGSMVAMLASNSLAAKLVIKNFPFDPSTDIVPLGIAGTFPLGFAVSPKIGVATFTEYLGWLKQGDAKRRRLGNTSSEAFIDVLGRTISRAFDVDLQIVPYRGALPMVNDLEEGRIPAAVTAATSLLRHHRGHGLKLLMTSGPSRMRVAPDVPTAREVGVAALEMQEWYGFFAARATEPDIVAEWNRQLRLVLMEPEIVSEMAQLGLDAEPSTPTEAEARLAAHVESWRIRMKEAGMIPVN
jgi:tripartite-type tricarboxylate transporter receptor subunit TctC